jgi:hypothetical protein
MKLTRSPKDVWFHSSHKIKQTRTMKLSTIIAFLAFATPTKASDAADEESFLRGLAANRPNDNGKGNDDTTSMKVVMDRRQSVIDFWTPARVKAAKPRHLTLDTDTIPGKGNGDGNNRQRKLQNKVGEGAWEGGGDILKAAGRLIFQMGGSYWICSATTVMDGDTTNANTANDRSLILTAGHCAYDDEEKKFATNVMFVPNQDDDQNDSSDLKCSNVLEVILYQKLLGMVPTDKAQTFVARHQPRPLMPIWLECRCAWPP